MFILPCGGLFQSKKLTENQLKKSWLSTDWQTELASQVVRWGQEPEHWHEIDNREGGEKVPFSEVGSCKNGETSFWHENLKWQHLQDEPATEIKLTGQQ